MDAPGSRASDGEVPVAMRVGPATTAPVATSSRRSHSPATDASASQ